MHCLLVVKLGLGYFVDGVKYARELEYLIYVSKRRGLRRDVSREQCISALQVQLWEKREMDWRIEQCVPLCR